MDTDRYDQFTHKDFKYAIYLPIDIHFGSLWLTKFGAMGPKKTNLCLYDAIKVQDVLYGNAMLF